MESRRRAAETGASGRVRRTLAAGAHRVFEAPLDQRRGDNPVTGQEICTGLSLHHDAHDATLKVAALERLVDRQAMEIEASQRGL